MKDATVSAVAGNPQCGDMITFYLKINEQDVSEKSTFERTEKINQMKLEDAWKILWKSIVEELGGLPAVKFHYGILAVGALRRAIRASYKMRQQIPEWLPKELTFEEKQALEEELAKILSKRMKMVEEGA